MDIKQLKDLISFVDKQQNIGEVNVEVDKKYKVVIKQKGISSTAIVETISSTANVPVLPAANVATAQAPVAAQTEPKSPTNTITIKSPMIGTFYRKPSPSKPNFVEVGDVIEKGKVVCIIEAMKLFNNIESEISGRIVKILVNDASPVEFDQPLFVVEPL